MAVTITTGQVAVAIRAATAADDVPEAIATVLGFLVPAATAIILEYAPGAPNAVHDAALIRLAGWLYDADPTEPAIGRAMAVSGAAPLLAQWRSHRAAPVGDAAAGATPAPSGIPIPPDNGDFILTTRNGVLAWVAFPLP